MTDAPFDPLGMWQDMLRKWEAEVNTWSGKLTEREDVSAMIGHFAKMSVATQKAMTDKMEEYLRSLNLPTRQQVAGLAERLDAIDESIERLRVSIGAGINAEPPTSTPQEPKRSRTPPA